jgi:hypothetical protein
MTGTRAPRKVLCRGTRYAYDAFAQPAADESTMALQLLVLALLIRVEPALAVTSADLSRKARTFAPRAIAKPVNLPAWRKVTVNMAHVLERHTPGGALSAARTVFPRTMNEKGIMRAIRDAYNSGTKVGVQGTDRVSYSARELACKLKSGSTK